MRVTMWATMGDHEGDHVGGPVACRRYVDGHVGNHVVDM
jgi:hypothetical protein